MADSNITKRALAAALKELMQDTPFCSISIADICHRCDMNRKSFYYHFKDKYDLLNWIYDYEFLMAAKRKDYGAAWEFMEDLLAHLYRNRSFYRKALEVRGQNSFHAHFRALMCPVVEARLREVLPAAEIGRFQVAFYTDAIMGTLERWLGEKECEPPEMLLAQLKSCFRYMANGS